MRKILALAVFLPFLAFAQADKTEKKSSEQQTSEAKATAKKSGQLKLVDLNTATEAQLRQLPGVDQAMAKKIIANRPYVTVEDLARSGIPVELEREVRTRVTVSPKTGASDRHEKEKPGKQ
jgi:competence protein ComEA